MSSPVPDIPVIPRTPELSVPLSFGLAKPAVLFPVRLETRFFPQADGNVELRVRVYPDAIHVDAHEPALTAEELAWGQHFWEQTWRAASDEQRAKAAWQQLADRFDPPRAAWIASALEPQNPVDRPATPMPAEQPLTEPPIFPTPAIKTESWTRAPVTRVLPNRWTVLGYKNGQLVVNAIGMPIPDPLATGPDPSPSAQVNGDGIDEGMKWMVSYDAAEKAGMAVRARLAKEVAAAGFDFLLVFGIRDTLDRATEWAPRLAQLFDAHHYTGGLSFVLHGMPSNNTQDAPSGFSSNDPGYTESYRAERRPPAIDAGSNADVLATAFGLSHATPVFDHIPHAAENDLLDARHMNTALWEATWGYFLSQMLGVGGTNENPLTENDIAWLRSYFLDYVRAGGPLPAVRVGKQPYGVLPVTSLSAWKPPAAQVAEFARDITLRDFLDRLRALWRRNLGDVPRLGRTDDTAQEKGIDKDLAEVMSMDGLSSNYSIRNVIGRHYLEHLNIYLTAGSFEDVWDVTPQTPQERVALARARAIKRRSLAQWWTTQHTLAAAALQSLGVTTQPRLSKAVYAPPVVELRGALVQLDRTASLAPNYIASLLAVRDLNEVRDETALQPPPRALLYLLLRHSMLLEYAAAASRLLTDRGLTLAQRREPELVDFPLGQLTMTIWRQLVTRISVPQVSEPMELGKYLLGFKPDGEPDVAHEPRLKPLSDFRASLTYLSSLAVPRLEQLMSGTLDLCSHRLDAWITSLATKRLAEMRKANPTGVLVGGYGWVMNLTPAPVPAEVPPPPGEEAPIVQLPNNPGFVHTPSLSQAATVAVLRGGHLAHAGNQAPNDLLSIDLSSERVRLASHLLDGVRQGQPLGALLGYRFERRLQESGKPQFIATFRELAPLVARKQEESDHPPNKPLEAIAANNVVDGLALLRRWQAGKKTTPPQWNQATIPFGTSVGQQKVKLPPFDLSNPDTKVILAELTALEDAVDATSDALLAESVHQVVRGNPLRAASTVESIAGGEVPPPELEFARTPRTGIALTHRLVALFSNDPVLPSGWDPPVNPQRANAEPRLNAWAAMLLGSPANVRCTVERRDPSTDAVIGVKELRLTELGLAPLDFVYAVAGGPGGQQAEIEQRIIYEIKRRPDGFPPTSLIRINPNRQPTLNRTELSYGEFDEVLGAVRRLVAGTRAIHDTDLNPPQRADTFTVDVTELETRASEAVQSMGRLSDDLDAQLTSPDTADLEMLRTLMLRATTFGVGGAVPLSPAGATPADREVLFAQAGSIEAELAKRVGQLSELDRGFAAAAATPEARCAHALAQLRIVFGKAFLVLSRFAVSNAAELAHALADSVKVQDGDPLAALTWFRRMARVRDGTARLNQALTYSEALGGEKLVLSVAQLPHETGDRWVGLPLKTGQPLPGGKLSLVVQSSAAVDPTKPLAGLFIDEWVEVVPNRTETTGIAFQYDQPNAAPPQAILIAVPPELESPWTAWSLQQVLLETLDLARIRAVDPDALNEIGHYLPATYFAINTAGHTVSTDFATVR
jgi:hypothetical protein